MVFRKLLWHQTMLIRQLSTSWTWCESLRHNEWKLRSGRLLAQKYPEIAKKPSPLPHVVLLKYIFLWENQFWCENCTRKKTLQGKKRSPHTFPHTSWGEITPSSPSDLDLRFGTSKHFWQAETPGGVLSSRWYICYIY
jgi:hypothetical protein